MSRHSKNNTAHSFFTYYEKKKLKDSGTLKSRLGGETLRRFEDCWLCLRPAVNPVCTLGGYIYCRTCLMVNLATQKEENDRRFQQWEAEERERQYGRTRAEREAREAEVNAFIAANQAVPVSTSFYTTSSHPQVPTRKQRVDTDKAESRATSFWIAENTPDVSLTDAKRRRTSNGEAHVDSEGNASTRPPPPKHLFCPISKKRLRMKELVTVRPVLEPTTVSVEDTEGSAQAKWICAVTKKQIGHKKAVVIKQTGQVVLEECFENGLLNGLVPECPKLGLSDVIPLVPGGTGFASHNKVEAQLVRPVME